jgi:hypothetical protein
MLALVPALIVGRHVSSPRVVDERRFSGDQRRKFSTTKRQSSLPCSATEFGKTRMRSTFERSNTGTIRSTFRRTSRRLLRSARPARAGIASLMSIAAAALCVPEVAQANQVIATITGTVNYGTDRSGAFGFAPGASLAGQPFTITYIIDDTKGQQGVYSSSNGSPYGSYIQNVSLNNPITAVLTIHNTSLSFSIRPINSVLSYAKRQTSPAFDQLYFYLADVYTNSAGGDQLGVSVTIASGSTAFTNDYHWQSGVLYTVCCGGSASGEFDLTLKQQSAYGSLNPQTITLGELTCPTNAATQTTCPPQSPSLYFLDTSIGQFSEITNTTRPVVVGQPIQLFVFPVPAIAQAQPWVLDQSAIVGGYNPAVCPSTLKESPTWAQACIARVDAPQFTSLSALFYWIVPNTYSIEYDYNGGSVKADFNVEGPTSPGVLTKLGKVEAYPLPPRAKFIKLLDLTDPGNRNAVIGVEFSPPQTGNTTDYSTPPPDYSGKHEWVQLLANNSADEFTSNPSSVMHCAAVTGLDSTFPIAGFLADGTTPADSPDVMLPPPNSKLVEIDWTFEADMYLMWKAMKNNKTGTVVDGAIDVPLGFINWGFKATAAQEQGNWSVQSYSLQPAQPPFQIDQTRSGYPTWTTLFKYKSSFLNNGKPCY